EFLREELPATDIERSMFLEPVDFEDMGKMRLAAGKRGPDGAAKLKLLLEDENSGFVYSVEHRPATPWTCDNVSVLQVMDADADGLSDIVVVALYSDGGSDLFPSPHVYFRRSRGFVRYPELEQKINSDGFRSTEDVAGLAAKYLAED